jgi:ribonuclease-3 family protein
VRDASTGLRLARPTAASPEGLLSRWLPEAPDLKGAPARSWSPAALAFLGDSVWELYARRHFFSPARLHSSYVTKVSHVTRAEGQAAVVAALIKGPGGCLLTEEEVSVLRWGRNASTGKLPQRLRGNAGVYSDATALEVLLGWLYVTDGARLDELMTVIGWDSKPLPPKVPS